MSKPRSIPQTRFQVFIVEPEPGFCPNNWRNTPERYRIVEFQGNFQFKGSADVEKFIHNHQAMQKNNFDRWAICVELFKLERAKPGSFSKLIPIRSRQQLVK